METLSTLRNLRLFPQTDSQLESLRAEKWVRYPPAPPIPRQIGGKTFRFRPGLTLTPFANPVPCNAHCRFCSEELQRRDGHQLTAKRYIRDHDQYFAGLERALGVLEGLPIGLSLSGLEATAAPAWLLRLLDVTEGFGFDERVLYTNGTGLYGNPLVRQRFLRGRGFDRIELSRCHYSQAVNQRIMYINRNEPIWENGPYEEMVRALCPVVEVKNSCILTQPGIHTVADMEAYLDWAMDLGVRSVVFRELSRLDDSYLPNPTALWVEQNRVPIEPLLEAICPSISGTRAGWRYAGSTLGYYYYNEHFRYQDCVEVILETSSYPALRSANATDIVQKLVFHSNGNLCGDWDPDAHVIGHFF